MKDQEEVYAVANKKFSIDEIKEHIKHAEDLGADYMNAEWSGDPVWAYQWIRFYKRISPEEQKLIEIQELEEKLQRLKNQ